MALAKISRIAAFVLLFFFLTLLSFSLSRSGEGPWHGKLAELWQKQQWFGIRSLAENLYQAGIHDSESLFLAMLASHQGQNSAGVQVFGERFLQQKTMNWRMEVIASRVYSPSSPFKKALVYRARFVFLIVCLLAAAIGLSLYRRQIAMISIGSLAAIGSLALLI